MAADVNLMAPQTGQFAQELFAVLHIGVVRFIVTEKAPDRTEFFTDFRGVDANGHRKFLVAGRRLCGQSSMVGCEKKSEYCLRNDVPKSIHSISRFVIHWLLVIRH